MAYDEALAERIRALLADEPGLTEQKMFGGLGFLLHGNMAAAARSKGGLMLRVDPEQGEDLLGDHVRPMVMRGKPMTGWLEVDDEAIGTDEALGALVAIGRDHARSLPPK